MPFTIVRQDITHMAVDAIVNAANTDLLMGGGVCGSIFKAAGVSQLQAACNKLAPIGTGDAVITPGFSLPARFVIHTAGPVYRGGGYGEEALLRSCYLNCLKRALENKCQSIAFPLISSGIYGYPKDKALHIASATIQEFLGAHDLDVYLAVFDTSSFLISEKLLGDVESYIDEHYVNEHKHRRTLLDVECTSLQEASRTRSYKAAPLAPLPSGVGLDELVGRLDESFSASLLRLIDAKGKTDVDVYKRANIDRKLFSKIRADKSYMPSKRTAIALAVALELSLDDMDNLLERAGFALSHSQKFDVIVEYFVVNGNYNIYEMNEVLFKYDQPLLGG